jgi:hypothetical protein
MVSVASLSDRFYSNVFRIGLKNQVAASEALQTSDYAAEVGFEPGIFGAASR